jgi:hypothetical protein
VPNQRLLCPLLLTLAACATSPAEAKQPRLSEAEVQALIERGRALLDAGQPAEAEALFATAAEGDAHSLRTRMWVLRAWMDQGRSNDTLDALDALDHAGQKGPEMTYLYGMAFARRAEGYIEDGVTDSSVQNNFLDATAFLSQVTRADASLYHDAFLPLARSAWYVSDFETARWAADRAVELAADSPEAWLERGRIAMAQFGAAREADPESELAQAHLGDAVVSFQRALGAFATRTSAEDAARRAEAAMQLGHAFLWQKKTADATAAYAQAIAANPAGFDYGATYESLKGAPQDLEDDRPSGFRAALEEAAAQFPASTATQDPGSGTLYWWLGWARFSAADWRRSQEAFQLALARAPEFSNAWFYIGLARQYLKDSAGAVEAMRTGWAADPPSMVSAAASSGGAQRAFESLLFWCSEQEPARNLDAAFLSEMLTQAMPSEPRHWNNLGLFLRDEGERLELDAYKKKTPKPDKALLADLYRRAYSAYQHALELHPGDPQLVNDTALMLHYHLDGDPSEVERQYRHALQLTEGLLAGELSADDRARYEQTQKDIAVNLKLLLEPDAEDDEEDGNTDRNNDEAKSAATQPAEAAAASGGG